MNDHLQRRVQQEGRLVFSPDGKFIWEHPAYHRNSTPAEERWFTQKQWLLYPEMIAEYNVLRSEVVVQLRPFIHIWVERQSDGKYRIHWYRGRNYWFASDKRRKQRLFLDTVQGDTGFEMATLEDMEEQYDRLCASVRKRAQDCMIITERGVW